MAASTTPTPSETILQPPSHESAGALVSKTFELLEQILSEQSTKDLARWQRVSRQWVDVIANSTPLAQKIFTSPAQAHLRLGWMPPAFRIPFTGRALEPYFTDKPEDEGKRTAVVANLHPALRSTDPSPKKAIKFAFDPNHYLGHDASAAWRNWFLTQPPTKKVVMACEFGTDCLDDWMLCNGTIKDPKGVRLGALMDKIQREVDWLETTGAYALPPHVDVLDERAALQHRLHKSFMKKLKFYKVECTAKGVVSADCTWAILVKAREKEKEEQALRGGNGGVRSLVAAILAAEDDD